MELRPGTFQIPSWLHCEPLSPTRSGRVASTRRSLAITLSLASQFGTDIDPMVQIFTRRAKLLRRTWVKRPEMQHMFDTIIKYYHELHAFGTRHSEVIISTLALAPPPGTAGRSEWKQRHIPLGPIGLLLKRAT